MQNDRNEEKLVQALPSLGRTAFQIVLGTFQINVCVATSTAKELFWCACFQVTADLNVQIRCQKHTIQVACV